MTIFKNENLKKSNQSIDRLIHPSVEKDEIDQKKRPTDQSIILI